MRDYLPMFLAEGREHLQELNLAVVRVEEQPDDQETIDAIFRIAHSMKSMSATMGYGGMATLAHAMEDVFELLRPRRGGLDREAVDVLLECLDALAAAVDAIDESGEEQFDAAPLVERLRRLVGERTPEQKAARPCSPDPTVNARPKAARTIGKGSSTVRVDAERLDGLMQLMGELVLHRTQIEALAADAGIPALTDATRDLARTTDDLQAMVMEMRMIPVEAIFLRFPRLVRDLTTKLGKQVALELVGTETELDRAVVDALGDPLVHLIRNALAHGLECPAEREAAGKPATGTLTISARHEDGDVVLEVRDDGRGIDPAKVARKAAERGLIPGEAIDSVGTARAVELLFSPGLTTAEVTSDVSGRGVGMDAVRTTIRGLGGEVAMTSELGRGTCARIRLPLTRRSSTPQDTELHLTGTVLLLVLPADADAMCRMLGVEPDHEFSRSAPGEIGNAGLGS